MSRALSVRQDATVPSLNKVKKIVATDLQGEPHSCSGLFIGKHVALFCCCVLDMSLNDRYS